MITRPWKSLHCTMCSISCAFSIKGDSHGQNVPRTAYRQCFPIKTYQIYPPWTLLGAVKGNRSQIHNIDFKYFDINGLSKA